MVRGERGGWKGVILENKKERGREGGREGEGGGREK